MKVDTSKIDAWFADCQKSQGMVVEKIAAADSQDWKMTTTPDGRANNIEHYTGRLHKIVFLRAWEPLRKQWVDRCLLEPIAEGKSKSYAMILLAMCRGKYLVQAKGEPGNNTPNRVILTATVQASYASISMGLSGGVPFAELYDDPACRKVSIVQDGGQLFNKTNDICLIELQEEPQDMPERFYWVTLEEIKNFASRGLVSEFLMQALGMLFLGDDNVT